MNNTQDFEHLFAGHEYALNTLINGNISECILYLRSLRRTGITGQSVTHEELKKIAEFVPDKYEFIQRSVYSFRYQNDHE